MIPRCMVFDFFGVICSEVAPFWLADHFSDEVATDVKIRLVGAADRGELSQRALFATLSELTRVPAEQIETQWLAKAQIDAEMVRLIRELSNGTRLALLTNAPSEFVRHLLNVHELVSLFEVIVISSECRIAKPDPRSYRLVLSDLGVSARDALFVDDNPVNIDGARSVGMQALLFSSAKDLRDQLGIGLV